MINNFNFLDLNINQVDLNNMDVENDVLKVKQNLRRLKYKLLTEELSVEESMEKLEKYKDLSMEVNEKIQNVTWKIFKSDFVQNYEKEKRRSYFDEIEKSIIFKQKPKDSESSKRSLEDHIELRESLSNKLELLIKRNKEKEQLILDLELTLKKLEEENNALMQKLLTDLEEKEDEEKKLEDILEEIKTEEENISFAVN